MGRWLSKLKGLCALFPTYIALSLIRLSPGLSGLSKDQIDEDALADDLAKELMADYLSGDPWLCYHDQSGGVHAMGDPQNEWFIMTINPIKMHDLEVPPF